ncbi:MAG: hypothetical protein QM767_29375 [Anaeromyxobacter sp.]
MQPHQAPPLPASPAPRFRAGAVLRTTFAVWLRHLVPLSALGLLLIAAPALLIHRYSTAHPEAAGAGGLMLAISVFLGRAHAAALSEGALRVLRGEALPPVFDLARSGLARGGRMMAVGLFAYLLPMLVALVTWMIALVVAGLVGVGGAATAQPAQEMTLAMLLASLTPELKRTLVAAAVVAYAAACWPLLRVFVADAAAVAEPGLGALQAVHRSIALTRGRLGRLVPVLLLSSVILAAQQAGQLHVLGLEGDAQVTGMVVLAVGAAVLEAFGCVAGVAAYEALRAERAEPISSR